MRALPHDLHRLPGWLLAFISDWVDRCGKVRNRHLECTISPLVARQSTFFIGYRVGHLAFISDWVDCCGHFSCFPCAGSAQRGHELSCTSFRFSLLSFNCVRSARVRSFAVGVGAPTYIIHAYVSTRMSFPCLCGQHEPPGPAPGELPGPRNVYVHCSRACAASTASGARTFELKGPRNACNHMCSLTARIGRGGGGRLGPGDLHCRALSSRTHNAFAAHPPLPQCARGV